MTLTLLPNINMDGSSNKDQRNASGGIGTPRGRGIVPVLARVVIAQRATLGVYRELRGGIGYREEAIPTEDIFK